MDRVYIGNCAAVIETATPGTIQWATDAKLHSQIQYFHDSIHFLA